MDGQLNYDDQTPLWSLLERNGVTHRCQKALAERESRLLDARYCEACVARGNDAHKPFCPGAPLA